ncbi:unnamed protein product, partial [Polarella glacialis]
MEDAACAGRLETGIETEEVPCLEVSSDSAPGRARLDELKQLPAPEPCHVLTSLLTDEDDGSCFDTSDFESLSSCGFSEISEIPEAILEGSSSSSETSRSSRRSGGRPLPTAASAELSELLRSSGFEPLSSRMSRPPNVVFAWPVEQHPTEASFSASGPMVKCALGARSPVRRARVRGTVCLPTASFQGRSEPAFSPPARSSPSSSPPPQAWHFGVRLNDERAKLELERELAARRAEASELAREAERAAYEAELARSAQEAIDRQAVLMALNHDRTELAIMYREANKELCRLRAELSQRTVQLLELRQEGGERDRRRLTAQPAQNTCV